MTTPIFRFAPSPNGHLHLGHAYSALLNQKMARETGGKLLLRIEDIDRERCTPELEAQMLRDLEWIGFDWDEEPRRQSEHFEEYAEAVRGLRKLDVIYPSTLSRSEIKKAIKAKRDAGVVWPNDPDGSPLYPGTEKDLSKTAQAEIMASGKQYTLRLNVSKALQLAETDLNWIETSAKQEKTVEANPADWGDVIIARKEMPVSYHLCCTLDDALQGITHVVRGQDLYHATSIHVLLAQLLNLPQPKYHHHELILDDDGKKLSKSLKHTSLKDLRESGYSLKDLKVKLGLSAQIDASQCTRT